MKALFKSDIFRNEFGGSLLQGSRKSTRPFERDQVMICVLNSHWCQQNQSFYQKQKQLKAIILSQAKNFEIKILKIKILNDQIHFLYKSRKRLSVARFFKSICGLIARKHAQSEKGKPLKTPFWSDRPWTSVLNFKSWSHHEFKSIYDYIKLNQIIANIENNSSYIKAAPS